MGTEWCGLNNSDQSIFWATLAFLNGRLEERATLWWALRLGPTDTATRLAVLHVIDSPSGREIHEPWRSAWRLIEESWGTPSREGSSVGVYDAQQRLNSGDRSGALIDRIVKLVSPRLSLRPFNADVSLPGMQLRKRRSRLTKVEHLLTAELTSGETIDPDVLKLDNVTERDFIASLALALDAAVAKGLDTARRLAGRAEGNFRQLGDFHRVYYVRTIDREDQEEEPDEYNHGIAPSVKLLHMVVSRLAGIDIPAAAQFVRRWKETDSPIHLRLWAALSRDSRITPPGDAGTTLLSLGDREFWKIRVYPEIAELRARCFNNLDPQQQEEITARIRRLPPRSFWPRKADAGQVADARLYWALRELRRIEVSGASLPHNGKAWLEASIRRFPDLVAVTRADEGFPGAPVVYAIPANPDSRFDLLAGEERLKMLENALSSSDDGWDDDPAKDWIQEPGHPMQILADLESVPDGGAAFVRVWNRFGCAHSPATAQIKDTAQRDLRAESNRVLSLLSRLPEAGMRAAVEGISNWLSQWRDQFIRSPQGLSVWLRFWPVAVEATNTRKTHEEEPDFSTILIPSSEQEPKGPDTQCTPVGRLVGIFLAACPDLREDQHPFSVDGAPRMMRDAVIDAPGESGLIARHRMIEELAYFLKADRAWTQEYLIAPLMTDSDEARTLWHAVARRRRSSEVLKIIGDAMAGHATDRRLGRETQRSLVFSLVVECLHALREQREPAVAYSRITQMLRLLDDETRASAAEVAQRFVRDNSTPRSREPPLSSPEDLFHSAVASFLQGVWPQERFLTTPGVSKALADLPAATEGAFAEAVEAIERFLVPFECWSMLDYGLYGQEAGRRKLSSVDNQKKADALLRLLDLTVGKTEGSVVPHDLANALDQIREISPGLTETRKFRRLATAARRG